MGYSITIGELEIDFESEERYICLSAKAENHENAPAFGEPTDFTNQRWPSYSAWHNFLNSVGLADIFYDENGHALGGHPGAVPINATIVEQVRQALDYRRLSNGGREPGFSVKLIQVDGKFQEVDDGTNKDYDLARLIWLDYWCRWAVENCGRPVIANS